MTDVTLEAALDALYALADPVRAAEMAAYHKIERPYLGLSNPQVDDLVRDWRAVCTIEGRIALADGLWQSGSHEGMIAAAKLLTQARIRPDDTAAWQLIAGWVEEFEGWAVADHACSAGGRRLIADPSRLDVVEGWTTHDNMWTRRAALSPAWIISRTRLSWSVSSMPSTGRCLRVTVFGAGCGRWCTRHRGVEVRCFHCVAAASAHSWAMYLGGSIAESALFGRGYR